MRPIGRIADEASAKRFGDVLHDRDIANQVDSTTRGDWEVWILDDDNVGPSKSLLEQFRRNPDDPAFLQTPRRREPDEVVEVPKRSRVVDARTMIFYAPPVPLGPLSIALIAISIAVTFLTDFGKETRLTQILSISQFLDPMGQYFEWNNTLPEIRRGEIWRLFTPMFLHFNILHIFFNVLWLRDLGSMIEARKTSRFMLLLTLVLAATSNVGQYLYDGPSFGGMSGVVYGLFGYIWMQSRFNPVSKLSLQPQTVLFMIVWFFVCLSGKLGGVANVAHGVGLAVGVAWGFLEARWSVALRRS
ncbi:MAG: rhomboid family intramembrane serine protease [Phycisphaerales bacterium]